MALALSIFIFASLCIGAICSGVLHLALSADIAAARKDKGRV